MSVHTEINFETEICEHLATAGWMYSDNGTDYDRKLALFPADVLAWVQTTQPDAWMRYQRITGPLRRIRC